MIAGVLQYQLIMNPGGEPLVDESGRLGVPGPVFVGSGGGSLGDFPIIAGSGGGDGPAPNVLTLATFQFATSRDGSGNPVFDFSDFDQDDVEASLASLLDGLASAWADLVGVSEETVQSHMIVNRLWMMQSAGQIGNLGIINESMTYPT